MLLKFVCFLELPGIGCYNAPRRSTDTAESAQLITSTMFRTGCESWLTAEPIGIGEQVVTLCLVGNAA